jgi:phosphohistidine phosphatase SixA
MTLRILLGAVLCSLLTLVPGPDPRADDAEVARLLESPGVHAIMRHALAPGGGDPSNFDVNDCTTQRNLDDRGRAQAAALGARLRELGVTFDEVRTSQWCRCRDTATQMDVGPVVEAPELNSFFEDRARGPVQTADLRAFLASVPENRRVLMVTHQVNVTALIGGFPSSGEMFLIRMREDGEVEVVGSMLIDP